MNSDNLQEPGAAFGSLLKYYRQRTNDPERGGCLTQARLAELADRGFSDAMVGHWETGKRTIRHQDRLILCSLIKVLSQYGGLQTLSEANLLLESGFYSQLRPEEIQEINPSWLTRQIETLNSSLPHSPVTLMLFPETFIAWLGVLFRWSEADAHARSSWAGMFIWSLSAVMDRITAYNLFNFLSVLILWVLASWLIVPMLQWPLDNPEMRLRASVLFAISSIVIPLLIALLSNSDVPIKHLEGRNQQKKVHFLLKLTGASVGLNMMSTLLLFLALGLFYLEYSLPLWGWRIALLAPLLMAYISARRIPVDRYKMYAGNLQLHPADPLFLIVFLLIGSGVGIFVCLWYEMLANRAMGVSFLLLLAGLVLWHRQKRSPLPDYVLILIIGVLIPSLILLLFLFEPASEEFTVIVRNTSYLEWLLVFTYVISLITIWVTVQLRNPPTLTLRGTFAMLFISLLLLAILKQDLFWGRLATLLFVMLWVVWGRIRFRSYFWVHGSVGFLIIVLGSSLFLVEKRHVSIWLNVIGYIITSIGLITWAYRSSNSQSKIH